MVGELTKSFDKIGLDMRVAALVSATSLPVCLVFFFPFSLALRIIFSFYMAENLDQ